MARKRSPSARGELSRAAGQLLFAIVALVALLAFVNSGALTALSSAVGQNMASALASNLAAHGATPAPGITWAAADYQACSDAYEAVKGWPGQTALVAIDKVLYGGSTDVVPVRDAVRSATPPISLRRHRCIP